MFLGKILDLDQVATIHWFVVFVTFDFTSLNLKLSALSLPAFKTFSLSDEMIEYYKNEHNKILDALKNKDFLEETLFYLEYEGF